MNTRQFTVIRLAILGLASALVLGLGGCSAQQECYEQGYSRSYSNRSAAVYVTVNSDELIVYNDTPYPIYHSTFSTKYLDSIEWGPCDRPDECPDLKIDPSEARHEDLSLFRNDVERSVTVFWWHIFDPEAELDVDYVGVQIIHADLPPRVPCE